MNEIYPQIETWTIPNSALSQSLEEMANDGRKGNEGVVLWLGRRNMRDAVVTHLLRLRGPGVTKQPDLLMIDSDLMNDVADAAIQLDLQLIGQIHSHGPQHDVDLSFTDLRFGISVPGYLSVVAPDYALRPGITIANCGVHVCKVDRRFARLKDGEISQRIKTNSSNLVPMLTVGAD